MSRRRFDVLLLDSGGTIFDGSAAEPVTPAEAFAGRFDRAGRAAVALGWAGDPYRLAGLLKGLEPELQQTLGDHYGFDKLLLEAGKRIDPGIEPERAAILADAFAGPRYISWLFPDAHRNFRRLREAGVVLGVVANTAWPGYVLARAMTGVELMDYFDVLVCSCDVGIAKPERRIFELAVRQLGGKRGRRVCYVGNSLERDVAGAEAMGWPCAFRLAADATSDGRADFEFDRWGELADWVLSD